MKIKGIQFYSWCLILIILGVVNQAVANTPFYFIAKPVKPLSGDSQPQSVYLRWDSVESQLPDDVARIELLRDGQVLMNKSVDQIKSAAEIMALYQRPGQERQLLQTLTNLQELAFSEDKTLTPSDYADKLRDRIINDKAYAYLASRQDFNVALARYRAYIDKPIGKTSYNYELVAISNSNVRARLGYVTVDMTKSYQVLAASDFSQVVSGQCDSPNHFKYNYSVALDWQSPGKTNQTDAFKSDIAIVGYDLFRTRDNLLPSAQTPPTRNIATLSFTSPFNAQGQQLLPGLEKVNRLPLMINTDNSGDPEWLETKDQLIAAGLKQGDRRAYYLVPKDFTGQYGPTSATIVVVPNLVRPKTPWDIDVFADNTQVKTPNDRTILSWDAVNYDNYIDAQLGQRQICNPEDASTTGLIEYVNKGASCQTDTKRSVRVDADDYLVYRFESFEVASTFRDSDGDGFADLAERPDQIQCNPAQRPQNAELYLLNPKGKEGDTVEVETYTVDGRERRRVSVVTSDAEKGQVYWYRIASRTADGRLSLLSQPIRAMFPNRNLPDKPTVEVLKPGSRVCGCRVETGDIGNSISTLDTSALNYSGNFTLSCNGTDTELSFKEFTKTGLLCTKVAANCTSDKSKSLSLNGSASNNGSGPYPLNCTVDYPENFDLCGVQQLKVLPEFCEGNFPTATGDVIAGPATITSKAPKGSCTSIYRSLGGKSARVATSCGTDDVSTTDFVLDQGLFCGYSVSHDKNNNISQAQVIPCLLVLDTTQLTPSVPQLIDLTLNTDSAVVRWRNPLEPVAVTLIEMTYTHVSGEKSTSGVSVPSAALGSGEAENFEINIPNLTEFPGRLCVRTRALSPNAQDTKSVSSPWSAPLCKDIVPNGQVEPDYLPWPTVDAISRGKNTTAHIGVEFRSEGRLFGLDQKFVDLFDFEIPNNDCQFNFNAALGTATVFRVFPIVECTLKTKTLFESQFGEYASFMLYRQSGDENNPGEWVQVSPLIDYAHWDYKGLKKPDGFKDDRRFYELNDPFIKLYYISDKDSGNFIWRAAVLDRYPYDFSKKHRYQIVYFDETHRIVHWRLSDWFDPAPLLNTQNGGESNE